MRFEYQLRLNQLNFYEQELTLLKDRLAELEKHDVGANHQVDFREIDDTIKQHMKELEAIRYHINKHESNVIHEAFKNNNDSIDISKNQSIDIKIKAFTNSYQSVKDQFYRLQDQLLK